MAKSSRGDALSPLRFAENLVRRSHQMQARLRRGEATNDFLVRMRDAALAQEKSGKPIDTDSGFPVPDQRNAATAQFLVETSDRLQRDLSDIRTKMAALEAEQKRLRGRSVDDLIEFLAIVWSDTDMAAVQATLKQFRPMLMELGTTDVELIKQARNAAKHL